jgi:hypothetical protein
MELSWFCATARFVPYWKIPGADPSIVAAFAARLATAPEVTMTAGKGKAGSSIVTSYGIWALICVGLTNTSGAGFPFTVTEVPASIIGNGTLAALAVVEARFVPKMLNSSQAQARCRNWRHSSRRLSRFEALKESSES